MTAIVAIVAIWTLAIACVLALCKMAAMSDKPPEDRQ